MTVRKMFIGVFSLDLLAVVVALIINFYSDVNHFAEEGFITILSVLQLLAISCLSFNVFRARSATRVSSWWNDPSVFWLVISFGFLFLAADELFMIHEHADVLIHKAFNIQETALTDRIDDIIMAVYGLAGIGILITFRDELKIFTASLPFFIWGFGFMFLMIALDVLTNRNDILPILFDKNRAVVLHAWISHVEDSLKIFAEAFFLLAFYAIWEKVKHMNEKIGNSD
jgi:hypothetical protein